MEFSIILSSENVLYGLSMEPFPLSSKALELKYMSIFGSSSGISSPSPAIRSLSALSLIKTSSIESSIIILPSIEATLSSAAKLAGMMTNNDRIIDKIMILLNFFFNNFSPNLILNFYLYNFNCIFNSQFSIS